MIQERKNRRKVDQIVVWRLSFSWFFHKKSSWCLWNFPDFPPVTKCFLLQIVATLLWLPKKMRVWPHKMRLYTLDIVEREKNYLYSREQNESTYVGRKLPCLLQKYAWIRNILLWYRAYIFWGVAIVHNFNIHLIVPVIQKKNNTSLWRCWRGKVWTEICSFFNGKMGFGH